MTTTSSRRFRSPPTALAVLAAAGLAACAQDATVGPRAPELECTIPTSRIFSGGPGRDGIPALTFPDVESAGTATFMHDTMRVIAVERNGAARAYPLFILWWHEIVNDTLGGQPIVVSYCPLTGSGLGFDPVLNGVRHRFGVSGLLYENNLIMFDRETESLWNQLLLGAQCGPATGTELPRIPVVETTWAQWKALHAAPTVVSPNTGHVRPYGEYPYRDYADPSNPVTLFPSSPWSRERPPKELVLGIREPDGSAVAYPFGLLAQAGASVAVNDRVGGRPIVVMWLGRERTAWAFDRRVGQPELEFDLTDAVPFTLMDRQTGSTWNARGEATAGPLAGARLTPVADAYTLFWFAWSVYYPETRLFAP